MSKDEVKKQEKRESTLAKDSIRKNGLIKMTESVRQTEDITNTNLTAETPNEQNTRTTNSKGKAKGEARHVYSIASFVNLFEDTELDKDSQIIAIKNEKISLNELFLESKSSFIPYNRIRIIYGEALI